MSREEGEGEEGGGGGEEGEGEEGGRGGGGEGGGGGEEGADVEGGCQYIDERGLHKGEGGGEGGCYERDFLSQLVCGTVWFPVVISSIEFCFEAL